MSQPAPLQRISPEQFRAEFIREFSTKVRQDPCWLRKWSSDPEWTAFMVGPDGVLERTGHSLGFQTGDVKFTHISRQYLLLDMAFFSYLREPNSNTPWNLEVAIEHENQSEAWLTEE